MRQDEIDEISDAFSEAWEEFFGQPMFYIQFIGAENPHSLYRESKKKMYAEDGKKPFYGTFKQELIEEKGEIGGRKETEVSEITFVTKELFEQGIIEVDSRDIIEVTNRAGYTHRYNIFGHLGKVQLGDNRVFTQLKVVKMDD
jgi:hypothetical protein